MNFGYRLAGSRSGGRAGSQFLFLKADGSEWLRSHQADPIDDANERGRIDPPINFHGLRHTWASHSVMNGVPLIIVARNLGHSDTRMVEMHYGHLAQSYVADAIREIQQLLNGRQALRLNPFGGQPIAFIQPPRRVVALWSDSPRGLMLRPLRPSAPTPTSWSLPVLS